MKVKVSFGFKRFQPGIRSTNNYYSKFISHVISKVPQEILVLKNYSLLHHQSAELAIGYRQFISKHVEQKNYHVKDDLSSFFT